VEEVRTQATHNRYFAEFAKLIQSVEDAMQVLAVQSNEILRLMGVYANLMTDTVSA
jgi:hypothetical protein